MRVQLHDELRGAVSFLVLIIIHKKPWPLSLTEVGPQILAVAAAVVADDGIGEVQDAHRAAVVLFQPDGHDVLVVPLELQNIADRGSPEAVNRLVVVTHNADPLMLPGNLAHDLKLCLIGILILIDHHIAEKLLILAAYSFVVLQQARGIEQDIVEIQGLVEQQALLV